MIRWFEKRIFRKIFIIGVGVLILSQWAVALVHISSSRHQFEEHLLLNAQAITYHFDERLMAALEWGAPFKEVATDLSSAMVLFHNHPELKVALKGVAILDLQGNVVGHSGTYEQNQSINHFDQPISLSEATAQLIHNHKEYQVLIPITKNKRHYGYFLVAYPSQLIEDKISKFILDTISITLVCLLFSGLIFNLGIARVLAPLKLITHKISYIAQSRDLSARVHTVARDEFSELANHFNQMAHELQKHEQALQEKTIALTEQQEALKRANDRLLVLLELSRKLTNTQNAHMAMLVAAQAIMTELRTPKQSNLHLLMPVKSKFSKRKFTHYRLSHQELQRLLPMLAIDQNHLDFSQFELKRSWFENWWYEISMHQCGMQQDKLVVPTWYAGELKCLLILDTVPEDKEVLDSLQFLEALSQSLAIAIHDIEFNEQLQEKVRMEGELRTAAAVQNSLLPSQLPKPQGLELANYFQSATETGGDWHGFMAEFDGHLLILIGDVMGHGSPAALVTATASATCRQIEDTHLKQGNPPDLSEMIVSLNKAVLLAGRGRYFMTFFAATLNLSTGLLEFANAGHNFPILIKPSGRMRQLTCAGAPLGMQKIPKFEVKYLHLNQGDTLFLYTDGVIENTDPSGSMWGLHHLRGNLKSLANQSAKKLVDRVVESAFGFYQDQPLEDDLTLVACHVKEPFKNSLDKANAA